MTLGKKPKKRIGEILIEEGYLDSKNLEKALQLQREQGGLLGAILVREGWISEENLIIALSQQLSIPYIQLSHYSVNREALKLIPRLVAEKYLFFPFDQDKKCISFAMSDPLNIEALEAIEKRIPFHVQIFLAAPVEIKEAIEIHYGRTKIEEATTPKKT